MKSKNILIVISVIILLIVLPLISYYYLKEGETLRNQRKVPPFQFLNYTGDSISSEDLKGSIYVANFVFTRCEYTCDELNKAFSALQDSIANQENLKLVTITIDPEFDTLPALKQYANKYNADPDRWYFLTGERQKIYDLVLGGFFGKVVYGETPQKMKADQKIALINEDGYIRGYYEIEDDEDVVTFINAVRKELNN